MALKQHPVLTFLLVVLSARVAAGGTGRDFVLAFSQSMGVDSTIPIKFVVTPTTSSNTTVNVVAPAFTNLLNHSAVIAPGKHLWLDANGGLRFGYGTLVEDFAIEVHASHDVKVIGYNIVSSNGDAYLAMSNQQLGQEYYSSCYYPLVSTGACFITVTTPTDGTEVRIHLPSLANVGTFWFNDTEFRGREVLTLTLNRKEVFQLQVLDDLTGTHVTSNQPIAVHAGFNRSYIYFPRCLSHGLTQLRPSYLWGKEFVAVPQPALLVNESRHNIDVYRMTSLYATTTVTIGGSPSQVIILKKPGDFHQFVTGDPTYIRADKPIQVVQTIASDDKSSNAIGDPAIQDMVPLSFAQSSVVFSTIQTSWRVVVGIVANASEVSGLRLNGNVISDVHWFPVNGSSHVVGYPELSPTSQAHTLSHSSGKNFMGYTFATVKCESFVIPVADGSRSDRTMCGTQSGYPGDGLDNDCDGQVDEDLCCANDPSRTADNLAYIDCAAPPGFSDLRKKFGEGVRVCCNATGGLYACVSDQKSARFDTSEKGVQRLAERMVRTAATRLLDCAMDCMKDLHCWGLNLSTGSDVKCDILLGLSAGRRYNASWRFFPMRASAESYAPFNV